MRKVYLYIIYAKPRCSARQHYVIAESTVGVEYAIKGQTEERERQLGENVWYYSSTRHDTIFCGTRSIVV